MEPDDGGLTPGPVALSEPGVEFGVDSSTGATWSTKSSPSMSNQDSGPAGDNPHAIAGDGVADRGDQLATTRSPHRRGLPEGITAAL